MTTFKIPTLVVVQRLPSLASLLYNASYVVLPYLQHSVIVSNEYNVADVVPTLYDALTLYNVGKLSY
mgnify:CR=1 FL=1